MFTLNVLYGIRVLVLQIPTGNTELYANTDSTYATNTTCSTSDAPYMSGHGYTTSANPSCPIPSFFSEPPSGTGELEPVAFPYCPVSSGHENPLDFHYQSEELLLPPPLDVVERPGHFDIRKVRTTDTMTSQNMVSVSSQVISEVTGENPKDKVSLDDRIKFYSNLREFVRILRLTFVVT